MKLAGLGFIVGMFFISHPIFSQNSCEDWNKEFETRFENFNKGKVGNKLVELDSLYSLVPEDCKIVEIYYNLTYSKSSINNGALEKGVEYAQKAFKTANQLGNVTFQKLALNFQQTCENKLGSTEESLAILNQAIALDCPPENKNCNVENVKLKVNKGTRLYNLGKNIEALTLLYEADSLTVLCSSCKKMNRVGIYNTIGNIYSQSGEYGKSIEAFAIALENLPKGRNAQYILFSNLATQFRKMNEPDSSILYLNKIINDCQIPSYLCAAYQGLGEINEDLDNKEGSIVNLRKALFYAKEGGIEKLIKDSQALLAKAYYNDSQYGKASQLFQEVDFSSFKSSDRQQNAIEEYYLLNELAKVDRKLESKFQKFCDVRDSLYDVEREEKIANLQSQFVERRLQDSLVKANLVIVNKELKIKSYRWRNITYLLFAIVLGFLLWFFVSRYKIQKSISESLVFEKNELTVINNQLKKKIEETNTPSLVHQKLELKGTNKTYFIDPKEILYIQAEDNGTRINTESSSFWADISLKKVLEKLPHDSFLQIYRSTIINIDCVTWVNHSSLKLNDQTELKIGRAYKKEVLSAFGKN